MWSFDWGGGEGGKIQSGWFKLNMAVQIYNTVGKTSALLVFYTHELKFYKGLLLINVYIIRSLLQSTNLKSQVRSPLESRVSQF